MVLISIIGFITHGEAISGQIFTTAFPFAVSWAVIAPWIGVYRGEATSTLRQLWRPALAAFLAAPIAAWLRGILLNNRPILPIFVAALGASAALGFALWRLIWYLMAERKPRNG